MLSYSRAIWWLSSCLLTSQCTGLLQNLFSLRLFFICHSRLYHFVLNEMCSSKFFSYGLCCVVLLPLDCLTWLNFWKTSWFGCVWKWFLIAACIELVFDTSHWGSTFHCQIFLLFPFGHDFCQVLAVPFTVFFNWAEIFVRVFLFSFSL